MKKFFIKTAILVCLAIFLSGLLAASKPALAQTTRTTYELLAPLPGMPQVIETSPANNPCPLGEYLNIVIKLIIGVSAVLAMVMIIVGGIEYMGSESFSSKESGKDTITHAILGLVLALGSWLILNTINPALLNACLKIPTVNIVIGADAGDDTIDPGFASGDLSYVNDNNVSPEIASAVTKLQQGWQIDQLRVYPNGRMLVGLRKGSQVDTSSIIDVSPGKNGYAPVGTATAGDGKTPMGSWTITGVRYTEGQAQFSKKGSNMGAAFWEIDSGRGIGFHGNKTGTLGVTNGCIRLKNADILALQQYIKVGIPVFIQ